VLGAAAAAAQAVPNRATAYLHPTDVSDARAIWVNPAGLAGITSASVYLDLTVGQPGARGQLRQLSLGFDSRGLAFSYQRDVLDGGRRGHTYKAGLAGGKGPLAAGFAVALYRGDTKGTGLDMGLTYRPSELLVVGGAIQNVGEPSVRGVKLPVTFVPGVSFQPFGPRAALSAHARVTTDAVQGYAIGARAGFGLVEALLRLDTDRAFRRTGFAIGIAIGGPDRLGAVATTPGDVSTLDAINLYGVSLRSFRR